MARGYVRNYELDIASLARSHAPLAIETLKALCASEKVPPGARIIAAVALLDRGYGKPTERIEFTAKIADTMSDAELNAELERIGKLIDLKAIESFPPASHDQSSGNPDQ